MSMLVAPYVGQVAQFQYTYPAQPGGLLYCWTFVTPRLAASFPIPIPGFISIGQCKVDIANILLQPSTLLNATGNLVTAIGIPPSLAFLGMQFDVQSVDLDLFTWTLRWASNDVEATTLPLGPPSTAFSVSATAGQAPLAVDFTDTSTGNPTSWAWDFNNDGIVDSSAQNPSWVYSANGLYSVRLTTTNVAGSSVLVRSGLVSVAPPPLVRFSLGNVIVARIGDGASTLSSAAAPVFVDEYTSSGTLVQSIAMPTSSSGSNKALTSTGSANSDGFLSISANGLYVLLTGYNAVPGTPQVATSANPPVQRVIARIDLAGAVDTSTALTDAYTGSNVRMAVSDDGNRFWMSGSTQGIRFVANLGDTTSVQVGSPPTNVRCLQVYNNQLWGTSGSSGFIGLWRAGNGLPTLPATGGGILEPGFAGTTGPSIYDFYFTSPTRVYIADDRTTGAGGIYRYDFTGGSWVQSYVLANNPTGGFRGLTGTTVNGVTTLYATATAVTSTTPNEVVSVVDLGPGSTFTSVALASPNTVFRGIRVVGP